MGGGIAPNSDTKTVVVLGAAYGGARAAQIVAAGLPDDWRIIVIDRNSHANHVYVMPRYAVLPGHEYKAFIPYTNVFLTAPNLKPNHIHVQAEVVSLRPHHVVLSKAFPELGIPSPTIAFDYAIYALGAHLPAPLDLWGVDPRQTIQKENSKPEDLWKYKGNKAEGVAWFLERQGVVRDAPTVLVVGGGALGIQFATDIKAVYPEKKVTLLHSREQLLPKFDQGLHDEVRKTTESQGIELILGERLDMSSVDESINAGKTVNEQGQRIVKTVKGREIAADLLLLCVGQKPNSGLLASMDPATINPENNLARVQRTMQLSTVPVLQCMPTDEALASAAESNLNVSEESSAKSEKAVVDKSASGYPHIFAIGDAADAFGAIAAGHNAYSQGELAARNVLRLIKQRNRAGAEVEELEKYTPGPPAIKVSLGLTHSVYQLGSHLGTKDDGKPDLDAALIWPYYGIKVEKDEDMKA
ncbi:FAD/NAD(P)-binding domain-containing protein [Coprinopsis marcescibilis]|uniref:FAD/NAD(P)-binding domain-containing protein n=1 Tax=Coprinopsis marcescibilis TaxID=230819 RepID=A0A5C3KPV8_COPMA|nr:FAD/NAD(P)-binding domain-containing protein [Coprinopsis marcescibilis]